MVQKRRYHYPEDFYEVDNFIMSPRQLEFFHKFKTACEYAGGRLISTQYHSAHKPIWFHCSACTSPHYNTWANYQQGYNSEFLCAYCMTNSSPTINYIREVFASKEVYLVSTEYINAFKPLEFLCSRCGRPHFISWAHFQQGQNPNLVCPLCMWNVSPTIEFIHLLFAERGAVLITDHYENSKQKLYFKCSHCGAIHCITWSNFIQGINSYLLCSRCLSLFHYNPEVFDLHGRNSELGGVHWYNFGRLFFNVKVGWQGLAKDIKTQKFSLHHIYSYNKYPLLRSSLTNGFPISSKFHRGFCFEFNIIHSDQWYNPESWNSEEFQNNFPQLYSELKLPYHNYPGFCFHNFVKYLVTETIIPTTDMEQIHQHEKYWKNKGIIYIPVSWETLAWKPTRDKFFSQIRDELRQFIPEIDQYTGVGFDFKEYLKNHSI